MIARAASATSLSSISSPQEFFDSTRAAFTRAQTRAGKTIQQDFSIGNFAVRFQFAGNALAPLVTRAMAHLAIPAASEPHLTLYGWDALSTGVAISAPKWNADDFLPGGEIRGLSDARFYVSFQADSGILAALDLEKNCGYVWYKSPPQIPDYELATPLRLPLYPWLIQNGLLPVHAGAVGLREGGVLLAGKSGSGKSNTALACLNSELGYASDDFCLVDLDSLTVHSLYSTGKIHARDLERLPNFRAHVANPDRMNRDKAVFFLHEPFPTKILARFPLRAILIPQLGNERSTRLAPASPAAALAALTPGTTLLLPSAAQKTFRSLADLARRVPCFYLHLSGNPTENSCAILEWLQR